jgi:protein TonB
MARTGLRGHLSGTVPISIALHLVGLLLILIIPLTANILLPDPAAHLPDYMRVAPMPPPPPALRVRAAAAPSPQPAINPGLAPTVAPSAIVPETGAPGPVPDVGATTDGVPGGIGTPAGGPPLVVPPPDPPRPNVPVRVADLPVSPRRIGDARPVYPEIARAARVEGTVILEAVLDTNGRVTQLRVLKSAAMLDQAALDAVRQWRYTPSFYGGHPVSVLMTITVRFQLQ